MREQKLTIKKARYDANTNGRAGGCESLVQQMLHVIGRIGYELRERERTR